MSRAPRPPCRASTGRLGARGDASESEYESDEETTRGLATLPRLWIEVCQKSKRLNENAATKASINPVTAETSCYNVRRHMYWYTVPTSDARCLTVRACSTGIAGKPGGRPRTSKKRTQPLERTLAILIQVRTLNPDSAVRNLVSSLCTLQTESTEVLFFVGL